MRRSSQSVEEMKHYAEFQKSLAERKALALQQQQLQLEQQRAASTPSSMTIPEVHDREINIGVEKQMLQLLAGISERTVEVQQPEFEYEKQSEGEMMSKL